MAELYWHTDPPNEAALDRHEEGQTGYYSGGSPSVVPWPPASVLLLGIQIWGPGTKMIE